MRRLYRTYLDLRRTANLLPAMPGYALILTLLSGSSSIRQNQANEVSNGP